MNPVIGIEDLMKKIIILEETNKKLEEELAETKEHLKNIKIKVVIRVEMLNINIIALPVFRIYFQMIHYHYKFVSKQKR